MPTHRQVMVEVPVTTRGFGNSGSAGVSSCFPTSPIGPNGDYNADDDIKALAQQLLLDGVVNDSGHTYGEFNRDYVDAPVIADVETGAGGLPATPFLPNPVSPGAGSVNASDMGAPPDGIGEQAPNTWGSGVGSQLDANASSQAISGHTIGDYVYGTSPGSTS